MSDPDFKGEEAPPPQPPRPNQPRTQLEADEQYARQLAEHYESSAHGSRGPQQPRRQTGLGQHEDEREHSFFDGNTPSYNIIRVATDKPTQTISP